MDEMKRQSLPYKHSESAYGHLTKLYLSKYLFCSPEQDYVKTKTLPFYVVSLKSCLNIQNINTSKPCYFFLSVIYLIYVCIFIIYLLYITDMMRDYEQKSH